MHRSIAIALALVTLLAPAAVLACGPWSEVETRFVGFSEDASHALVAVDVHRFGTRGSARTIRIEALDLGSLETTETLAVLDAASFSDEHALLAAADATIQHARARFPVMTYPMLVELGSPTDTHLAVFGTPAPVVARRGLAYGSAMVWVTPDGARALVTPQGSGQDEQPALVAVDLR